MIPLPCVWRFRDYLGAGQEGDEGAQPVGGWARRQVHDHAARRFVAVKFVHACELGAGGVARVHAWV